MNALKKYKGVEKILSSLRGKMKTGAKGLNKLSEGFEKLFDPIKNLSKEGCVDGRCFTEDTLVLTKHGYTAIKEIQKGDEILSRDEKTGRTGFKEVEDVFIRTVHTIYHVWLDGKEEIKTTAYHPVYVQGQGWVTAINLHEGDTLETMDSTACITKIAKERHEEPVTVCNLAVKDWVSYFVGQIRVYVHNRKKYKPNSNSKGYEFKEGIDVDLRGKGTVEDALEEAFKRVQEPKENFYVSQWSEIKNEYGKSVPVEWTSTKTKAQISIDLPHTNNPSAPQIPHVGYKTGGKKKKVKKQ